MPKADEFFGLGKMIDGWADESLWRQYIVIAAVSTVLASLIITILILLMV